MADRPAPRSSSSTEKVAVRGLAFLAAWIFLAWGGLVCLKGLYDLVWGQPEANFYSPRPWDFVTRPQWARWSAFEAVYGLACAGLGWAARTYAGRLPEWVAREKSSEELL